MSGKSHISGFIFTFVFIIPTNILDMRNFLWMRNSITAHVGRKAFSFSIRQVAEQERGLDFSLVYLNTLV